MEDRQAGLSRTLPKNFTFPSSADEPRTPKRASIHLDVPPPPPRAASCHSRRFRPRSGTDVSAQVYSDPISWNQNHSDIPLPSIEIPPPSSPLSNAAVAPSSAASRSTSNDRFLAPPRGRTALKTPPAQIRTTPTELNTTGAWSVWDSQQASGEVIQRPSSSCSHVSDSSVSSVETFASRPSEGSCTSTESDLQDPFFYLELPKRPVTLQSPLSLPEQNVVKQRRTHQVASKDRWTAEMDGHLWNTYQLYIQDPTITPFKMTPGSIPPLGVTHRVSREAKRTWDRKAFKLNRDILSQSQRRDDGNNTPTPKANGDATRPGWPRSEASTRRRLKLLCRRKFSIAPHYQRLMMSKSPAPLEGSSSRESSCFEGPGPSSATFATRDLGVSLMSSSVPGPLSQLAAEGPLQDVPVDFNDPFGSPKEPALATTAPEDSVVKRALGLDRPSAPRLGSPFTYHTWGPDNSSSKRKVHRHNPMGRRETIHVTTGFRLRSPPRMDLFSNIKNAPQAQDPSHASEPDAYSHLEEFARQGKLNDPGNRRVRIRNRGATTSSVNPRALHQLFSPPSSSSKDETIPRERPVSGHRRNLSGDSIKRLGSPFKLEGIRHRHSSSGRFVRHMPSSSSDPFGPAQIPQLKPSQSEGMLPYDATEPGLSDAERIRRQILNMQHSRR